MDKRVRFLPGNQTAFIEKVYRKTGFSTKQLADLIGIHPRSFFDWRKEKLTMTLHAVEYFVTTYDISLPEDKEVLLARWQTFKTAANKKGGVSCFKKYGIFATDEGRRKGGKVSWERRKNNLVLWKKYANVIIKPKESILFAEFIGILLGDGGLTKFQCVIYLNSDTDSEYAIYASHMINTLFGLKATITKHKKYRLLRVSVSSVDMIEYLLQKGLHLGNKVQLQVGVPDWILSKPEYIKACVRGLMDTDGCFVIHTYTVNGKQYSYPKIVFTNSSLPILEFVDRGLRILGFTPKKYENKRVWLLNQNEVKRYLKEIGTSNYKPTVKKILEGDSDGYENGLLNHDLFSGSMGSTPIPSATFV